MSADKPSISTVAKYALLQTPGIALVAVFLYLMRRWDLIGGWLAWIALFLWVAKDVLLFPRLWRSYEAGGRDGANTMVGERGTTVTALDPGGRVALRGELWHAETAEGAAGIGEDSRVRVSAVRGLTLIVEPEGEGGGERGPQS